MKRFGIILLIFQLLLEIEAFVFLMHDFHLGGFWRVFIPLGTHWLAVALMAIGFARVWDFHRSQDRAWAVVGLSMTLALPLLGYLGFLILYALGSDRPKTAGVLLRDFEAYISYDEVELGNPRKAADADRFILDQVDVSPLRDILSGRDVALKRGAILSLSRLPRRDAVDLLKGVLADPIREIRYYASTALSDMEREFNDRIFTLVRETERLPTSVDRHVELARIVLEYTEAGLLDEGMVRYFAEIGLRALDKASLISAEPRIHLMAAQLHRKGGSVEKAQKALEKYTASAPGDSAAALLLAEIAFERGDLATMCRIVEDARVRFPGESRFADLLRVLKDAAPAVLPPIPTDPASPPSDAAGPAPRDTSRYFATVPEPTTRKTSGYAEEEVLPPPAPEGKPPARDTDAFTESFFTAPDGSGRKRGGRGGS
jgi:hypothetical protein